MFVSKVTNRNNESLLNRYTQANDQALLMVSRFPVKLEIRMYFAALVKTWCYVQRFAVTKRIPIINDRVDFFLKLIFTTEQQIEFT